MSEGFFWVVWGLSGLTEGGGPSALRWMAARAEFPCGLTGGECGIGAALDACGWDWCCGGGFVEGLCKI